jgi:hypothetical protein
VCTLTGYGEPEQQATRARPCAIEQHEVIWQTHQFAKRFETKTNRTPSEIQQAVTISHGTTPSELQNLEHNKPKIAFPQNHQSSCQKPSKRRSTSDPKPQMTEPKQHIARGYHTTQNHHI